MGRQTRAARRVTARVTLAAAVLGLGICGWLAAVEHRWPAIVGAAMWAILGIVAFLYLWTDTERSTP